MVNHLTDIRNLHFLFNIYILQIKSAASFRAFRALSGYTKKTQPNRTIIPRFTMRFSSVIIMTLCTVVVTAVGSDDVDVRIDPVDFGGTIDASGKKCDELHLEYGCCDGPDFFDGWIVGSCDKCRPFLVTDGLGIDTDKRGDTQLTS